MKTKTQFMNRILSLVLSIMMVVSMLPMNIMTASAADGDAVAKVGDIEYTDFATAVANWTDGTTLTLLADVTGLTECIKTYAKGLILDLNGHKIECSDTLCTIWIDGDSGSELTIRDGKGDGYIQGRVYAVTGGSKLRLESGTVETVTANGDFIMTGGQIICEDSRGLLVNAAVDVVISGGEIYGSNYGVWIASGNVIISGDTKITGAGQYAITSFSSKVVISGTPTISGGAGEFRLMEKITLNTQPADGETWRVEIDTEEITDGIFAVHGEGVTLDASKFASTMDGYDVKQNAKGELLLCNHQTAYAAVSNEDGSTHKMLCCCRETTVEASVACSGFGATCQTKAVCAACGQSYGETNPDVHTFNDDGMCVCGAERDAATTVDLSSLTATYVISDSGEYIFTGTGSYGIKVESGNPKIVLNNVNISLTDGDYYENNPINGIHIATTGGTTEILVLGESSITAKAGAGIFVAEGGTVKITGSNREDILIATGASGCSGIGGYVYYTNGYVNCGNIEISSVTVKAFGSHSNMGDRTPAIGGAGNGNCGYITIDNADVYAEGFIDPYGNEGSSAIGTGVGWRNREGSTIDEISIINDSKVYVTRGNYCDYIGCSGSESDPAEGVVDATAKSSTIYCYDTTYTTKPIQTLKYGALGGLLKEDGTCEGEHTGIICDNCGYCSCTHEGGKLTYALTEDGAKHTATYDCCGMKVTEDHTLTHTANGNVITAICSENCGYGGKATISATGKTYDGTAVTADVEYSGGWTGSTDLTVTYAVKGGVVLTEAPKNAGTYTASIIYEDVTASYDFTIEKATPKAEDFVFAAPTDLIYDGTAKPATITVKDGIVGMGEVNIIYFRDAGMWIDNEREPIYPGRYKVGIWIKEGDNYKAVYSDERIWLGDEFEIKYLTTDAKADISGTMGSNGWYISDVTLTAPEGYQISKTKYNDGFESKLTISAEQNETITYYLKDVNGDVSEKTATLKIDKTAPSAKYQIGTDGWKQFINTITFGLFCKDYKTVDIEYTDDLSGIAEKQYYISSEEIIDTSSIAWLDYTDTLSLDATGKYFIYMRVVDNAGHEVILNTEGIVIYEDSIQVTESVSATYNAGTDKAVTVKFNGNTVNAIKNGNAVLTAGTDYTVSADGTITLKAFYLDALNAGEYTFTVSYNPQGVETDKVNMTTTFTVKVEKADGKVSNLNISGKTYDGTAVTAPTFDKLGDGAATIEYKVKGADDSTYTIIAPSAAGDYVVRVTVAESENYKAASATAEFSITSANIENAEVTLYPDTVVYDGSEQKPTVTVIWNGFTLTENTDYVVYYANNVNASDATVLGTVYVDGINNFKGRIEKEFEITNALITEVQVKQQGTLTYNGQKLTPVVTTNAKTVGGCPVTFTYSTLPYDTYGTMPGFTNAGTYTVYFKASAQNHNDYYGSFDVTIEKKAVTVTANDASKTYGDSNPALTYTNTALVGQDTLDITVTRASGENANTYTIAASQAEGANPNYEITFKTGTFTIHKATLTVTVEDKTATYGDAVPNYTVKYEGFKNGDDKDDLDGALAFECGYAQFSDKGEYTIKASGYTSGNYTISYVDGKLTVNAKPITVTIQNATSVYGDTLAELKATDNGIVNGDTNVYSLATTATGTSNVGKYAITGTALDSNYDVTFVNGEYEITKREITITVDAKNSVVNTTLPTYTYKVEGLVGVDTLVTEPTLACNANIALIGEYDITASGADAGGNYSIKYVPAKLTVLTDNAVDAAAGYTEELKDYDPATVTSEDKAELEEMLSEINTILADETTTDNGKKALEEVKEQVEKLIKEITDAAEATDTENTEKVENVTPENVTPENKTDLEGAKADLEKALEDNGGNYTEDEKKAIEDEIKRIDDALEVIGNVEAVEKVISKLPAVDTVKPDDEEAIKAITDAQTAYNALSDYGKSLVDEATKANLDKLVAALVAYDIVEGDGSSWTEDSDHNITFVVNGLFGKFVGIKVDGKDVDKANYEVKAGSTIITLKASYLDTLAVGEHTITVVYTDGSTDGAFNVHAKANSPATGDNSNMFLWIALLFISGGAVITLTVVDRKRRTVSNR